MTKSNSKSTAPESTAKYEAHLDKCDNCRRFTKTLGLRGYRCEEGLTLLHEIAAERIAQLMANGGIPNA